MLKLKNILLSEDSNGFDYRGQHTAPSRGSEDSPLYNVSLNTYPEDIYSNDGARLYGDGSPFDRESVSIIQSARNHPSKPIKIYRAVPKMETKEDLIAKYYKQKAYILKYGKLPPDAENMPYDYPTIKRVSDKYFQYIHDKLEALENGKFQVSANSKITKINDGDWVTINRKYAVQHGKSVLNNNYTILTMTVPAKHLYTDGNSVHEWGYDPS